MNHLRSLKLHNIFNHRYLTTLIGVDEMMFRECSNLYFSHLLPSVPINTCLFMPIASFMIGLVQESTGKDFLKLSNNKF